ncbi:unnamed protein product [Mycena citricolor]|uniref:Uncharacterized protein n=1 Tax=Mycena citricolor TaxID=2018698 RepID=A0AAD2Q6B2_9AGAR|nr:unnamed protein product [Mycena citricolor]
MRKTCRHPRPQVPQLPLSDLLSSAERRCLPRSYLKRLYPPNLDHLFSFNLVCAAPILSSHGHGLGSILEPFKQWC